MTDSQPRGSSLSNQSTGALYRLVQLDQGGARGIAEVGADKRADALYEIRVAARRRLALVQAGEEALGLRQDDELALALCRRQQLDDGVVRFAEELPRSSDLALDGGDVLLPQRTRGLIKHERGEEGV